MQNHYNLVYREEEREMFPTLDVSANSVHVSTLTLTLISITSQHFGVTSIPWSPLARGILTRPLSEQTTRGASDAYVPLSFLFPLLTSSSY